MGPHDRIEDTLNKLFAQSRIITWHDQKREMGSAFENIELEAVQKILIENNEFGVKHRIMYQEPDKKFLLYRPGVIPPDQDNWLLDIELGFPVFHADQASLWLTELGLGPAFKELVKQHRCFFEEDVLRERLSARVDPEISLRQLRFEMLGVCVDQEARLDEILMALLDQGAKKQTQAWELIHSCNLEDFFLRLLEEGYGYSAENPTLKDFVFTLFESAYSRGLGESSILNNDALVFIKHWKDSQSHRQSYRTWAETYAQMKNIENDLQDRDYRQLIEMDYFKVIDQKILRDLVRQVAESTITSKECQKILEKRRTTHWFDQFEEAYRAVVSASEFFYTLQQSDFTIHNVDEGIEKYTKYWYRIDQHYRQYIHYQKRSGYSTLFESLSTKVENHYQNNYLLKLSGEWQQALDQIAKWPKGNKSFQKYFYTDFVEPFLLENNKVFVVISDGLRYEIAEELTDLIRHEERYEATLKPMWSMLPSYTQLGMAALLPNIKLSFSESMTGAVDVDGNSAQGTENRGKILADKVPNGGLAMQMDEFVALNAMDARALIRENDVIYFYHNRIDNTGDKRLTETKVFEAVQETQDELLKFIYKLIIANANNILITADHGFIFQNRPIDESEFASVNVEGDKVFYKDRRFAIGKGLKEQDSLMKFSANDLGIDTDVEIQIPKANNRLRLKGAGSRYVHGGASLQELVVPVIHVHKLRNGEVRKVEVDVLGRGSQRITTGQFTATLYQREPVSENVYPRHLRVGLYTLEDVLISDRHEVICSSSSTNSQDREYPLQFILTSQAETANNQDVVLKLEEPIPETSHYQEYKALKYQLNRSIGSDFDF